MDDYRDDYSFRFPDSDRDYERALDTGEPMDEGFYPEWDGPDSMDEQYDPFEPHGLAPSWEDPWEAHSLMPPIPEWIGLPLEFEDSARLTRIFREFHPEFTPDDIPF